MAEKIGMTPEVVRSLISYSGEPSRLVLARHTEKLASGFEFERRRAVVTDWLKPTLFICGSVVMIEGEEFLIIAIEPAPPVPEGAVARTILTGWVEAA